MNINIIKL